MNWQNTLEVHGPLMIEVALGIAAWIAIYYWYPLESAIPIYANY